MTRGWTVPFDMRRRGWTWKTARRCFDLAFFLFAHRPPHKCRRCVHPRIFVTARYCMIDRSTNGRNIYGVIPPRPTSTSDRALFLAKQAFAWRLPHVDKVLRWVMISWLQCTCRKDG